MSVDRLVYCIKKKKQLPGLPYPPVPSELGKKVYENVSQEAWDEYIEFFKMIINEYRLDLTSPQADIIMEQKINEYFFDNEDIQMPEGYVPPET